MKKNEVQFRHIARHQDQPYKSRPLPRDGKMPPKLYRRLKREEKVGLKSESRIKDEKFFLVGNAIERRDLYYYRELIWRKGNSV